MLARVRMGIARHLESGPEAAPILPGVPGFARAIARLSAPIAARALARPLCAPEGVAIVCVGGATLGGSGKTRVALACTRALARRGVRVALVGHAYRARAGRSGPPRVVAPDDALADVGDEALACARALAAEASPAFVVVGRRRQDAVDRAASLGAEVVVIDGQLQTRPARAAFAILAVDADEPWGAGEVAPAGDLRAPIASLVAVADAIVRVDAAPSRAIVERLQGVRFGLFTALARPSRLARSLARAGLVPAVTIAVADHGPLDAATSRRVAAAEAATAGTQPDVDAWLATPKCALHLHLLRLRFAPARPRKPVVVLVDDVALPGPVAERLSHIAALRGFRPKAYPRA